MSRHCTMPRILGLREWYERRFGDLCERHDRDYASGVKRQHADLMMAAAIMERGYPVLALLTYWFVRLFGWMHYR